MRPSSLCAVLSVLLLVTEASTAHVSFKDTEAPKVPQPKPLLSKGPILAKVQVAEKAGQSSTGVPVTMIHEVAKVSTKIVGVKTVAAKTDVTKKGTANKATAKIVGTGIAVANTDVAKTAAGKNVEVNSVHSKAAVANTVVAKKLVGKTVATNAAVAAKTVAAKVVTAKAASSQEVVTKVAAAKTAAVVKHEPNQSTNINNKTKAVEVAVVSLPMASFALGDTKEVIIMNAPPKKDIVEASKAAVPKATGTFSLSPPNATHQKTHESESGVKSDKPSAKFMASKAPAPTQTKEVPALVPVKAVVAEPPQTEEEDEVDMDALKAISQAYQHKPAR